MTVGLWKSKTKFSPKSEIYSRAMIVLRCINASDAVMYVVKMSSKKCTTYRSNLVSLTEYVYNAYQAKIIKNAPMKKAIVR
jgi:hypothetical protein